MNPNAYPVQLSMGWGFPSGRTYASEKAEAERRKALHERAVARRRKAKRGGKR